MSMRRSIPTARGALIALAAALGVLASCSGTDTTENEAPAGPVLENVLQINGEDGPLQPVRLQWRADTLYVSYRGVSRLDLFDPDLKKIGSVPLEGPIQFRPSDFRVTENLIVLCDHASGAVVLFDRQGKYLDSYGSLPDGKTSLSPLTLDSYGGVAYISDIAQRRVMAVSLTDAEGITERGEMILSFPPPGSEPLGLPSAVSVTPDGRLLIGDAKQGEVRVFTCDGREVYTFEKIVSHPSIAPQAFALDDLMDDTLQDDESFDPSGIREMGRFHVVDGLNRVIHIFNPLGRYVLSYPTDTDLVGPSDIAIDQARNRILVADPAAAQIVVFRYGG